jgi:trehalose synthase
MAILKEVIVPPRDLEQLAPVVGPPALAEVRAAAARLLDRLRGGVIWNVSSTAVGGGVAEMLQPLIGYSRGAGLDVRWVVIEGSPEFFRFTKRLHHALHGSRGSGEPIDDAARGLYEATLAANAVELEARVQRGDVVLLHDPQTTGLAPSLARAGAHVIWRCHIGHDRRNEEVDRAWRFLAPYLAPARRLVFSRQAYVPEAVDGHRAVIIAPSIDAFSAKNAELAPEAVRGVLVHTGLVEGPATEGARLDFTRADGTRGRVDRRADVVRLGPAPAWDQPLVVQVSRWDPLKDMLGVLRGFARLTDVAPGAALVLAGPNVHGVADDPEGPIVFAEVLEAWRGLPHATRQRAHLVCLPTADVEENATIVNALQRHAAVVVQKSLREGFGLTVTEAMWKARPVVASRVGGIQDQIVHGESGLLLDDPSDLPAFAAALARVLRDEALATSLGGAARERVRERFLGVRHLLQYGVLIDGLL